MKPEKNNSFCSYPFAELTLKSFDAMGKVSGITPCCMMHDQAKSEDSPPHTSKSRLDLYAENYTPEELFNSPRMDQLRKNMLSNVRDSACRVCWDQEDAGMSSHRLYTKELTDDEINNPKLQVIDVTHSNICNLRCRMCHVGTSHSLVIDLEYFKKSDTDRLKLESATGDRWDVEYKLRDATSTTQWDWLEKNTDKITTFKASGGEPFYDKRILKLLEIYVNTDNAKNTELSFHTNVTMIDDYIIDLLKKFKTNNHVFSIDGYGPAYDYIRYPAKFDDVAKIIDKYLSSVESTIVHIACVVSSLNLLSMDKYIEWVDSMPPRAILNVADVRSYDRGTNISRLPVYILEVALDRIEKTTFGDSRDHKGRDNLIQLIKNAIKNNKEDKTKMLNEIVPFDNARSQSFKDFLDPLLVEWLTS